MESVLAKSSGSHPVDDSNQDQDLEGVASSPDAPPFQK